ncbi:MAG: peptide deformylase [Clostridia bacterium]|nr:peptide deformylase [Clostridia bacterium]
MAIRTIVVEGDDILRKVSKPVTKFDKKLWELLDDMRDTMRVSNGCGIAGVQVGVLRRIFIVEVEGMYLECINPEIVSVSEEVEEGMEGCLSVPNKRGYVIRPKQVKLKAFTREGTPFEVMLNDFMARAICHENDHLNGVLYIDKLVPHEDKKGKKE